MSASSTSTAAICRRRSRRPIEDRGFQSPTPSTRCARCSDGHLVDETRHMARLERSLGELSIAQPMSRRADLVMRERPPQSRPRGPGLSAGHPGVAPRDSCLPAARRGAAVVCLARSVSRPPKPAPLRASPSSPRRITAGAAATSRRWACCPTRSPSRRPARPAPRRPGSSTRRLRHRGRVEQRLDRRRVGRCHHAAIGRRYPPRRDASDATGRAQARRTSGDRAAVHGSPKPTRRAKPLSPRRRRP